ncbi:MAG: single-stranded-DNA-specific exonuclease RecJ [Gemmatimonadetes bacterium]|nr:single-stranded-DNA-specific exonuclease RecJ [Gemmatimonadota bacterium]
MEGGGLTLPSAIPKVEPRWEEPGEVPPDAVRALQEALSLPEVLCALLVQRDLADPDRAKAFLRPLLSELDLSDSLAGLAPATERVLDAVRRGETILVHGDYDVDGIAGATLLTRWIRRIGGKAIPFVPHRLRDGYDLGAAGIGAAKKAGAGLILTVDSGIRAHDAVADANAAGLDVIITDHHTPAETLPPALAVVNPNRVDCEYPNKGLCGTGVAYRLCESLVKQEGIDPEELYSSLDLVALATIADVVPLNQENRTLVRYGLKAMARTKLPGLRALMVRAGLGDGPIDAGQVAFRIAPRINAAGRMAEAMTALDLLMSDDLARISALADRLEDANELRREVEAGVLEDALEQLERSFDPAQDFGVVLEGKGWHPGVIGIVASRIVERIHRPTVLVAVSEALGRGSARSIPGFDLFGAVHACREHLGRFGGHRAAAGMDIAADRIDRFRVAFNAEVRERLGGEQPRPVLRPELQIPLTAMTERLAHMLSYLGPFGMGNPTPVFLARQVDLIRPATEVGKGHLKLHITQANHSVDAIGFGLVNRVPPESLGMGPVDVVFKLKLGVFKGRRQVEAHLLDVRRSESKGSYEARPLSADAGA